MASYSEQDAADGTRGNVRMTMRSLMRHRATLSRNSDTGTRDGLGQPIRRDAIIIHTLPCRAWSQGSKLIINADKTVNIGRHAMIVPMETDILEEDVVTNIRDRRGRLMFGDSIFRVDAVYQIETKGIIAELESAQ